MTLLKTQAGLLAALILTMAAAMAGDDKTSAPPGYSQVAAPRLQVIRFWAGETFGRRRGVVDFHVDLDAGARFDHGRPSRHCKFELGLRFFDGLCKFSCVNGPRWFCRPRSAPN
jgi:hypothetical protein